MSGANGVTPPPSPSMRNRSGCDHERDWGDMRYGHHIDVRAYHSHGRWMASTMHDWHDDWDDHGHMG
jgi:hypothetical protein